MADAIHVSEDLSKANQQAVRVIPQNILLLNPGGPELMMRGLIRERPTQYGFCWPSVDMILTSGLLNTSGHQLRFIDASIEGFTAKQVAEIVKKDKVDVVVSLYSHFYHQNDIDYLSVIKQENLRIKLVILPDIQFVLNAQKAVQFLENQRFIDAVILSITSNGIDRFLSGDEGEDLINLCYRVQDKVVLGPKDVVSVNDYHIPIPRHDLFKNKKYFLPESRHLYVTTTTMQFGCPYQCDFCLDKEAYKKSWCRSPENMLAEFEYIAQQGFKEVYLRDLTFGLNRKRALQFCQLLAERNLPLQWVCTTRVDTVDEELLTWMKKAGCFCIEFGIESGIDATKDIHKKGTKNEQAVKTFRICQRLGIETAMFMILGFPEESLDDIERSLQFAFELKGDFLSPNLANLLPETGFENTTLVQREGQAKENPWENYRFNEQNFSHPTISKHQMQGLLKRTLRRFYLRPTYIIKRIFKMRSWGALLRVSHVGWSVVKASFSKSKATR